MQKTAKITFVAFLMIVAGLVPAIAESEPAYEKTTSHAVRQDTSPALAELIELARQKAGDPQPQADAVIREIQNIQVPDALRRRVNIVDNGTDMVQRQQVAQERTLVSVSTGLGYSNSDNPGLVAPPDTNGDVGGDFYIFYVNLGWIILDKDTLTPVAGGGPFLGNTFWAGFGGVCETNNSGDPIVLYDHLADQWVFSQFTGGATPRQCFAISTTDDPMGPYHRYEFAFANFNDYPKIGMWQSADGTRSSYTLSVNEFAGSFAGASISVLERDVMLTNSGVPQQDRFFFATGGADVFFAISVPTLLGEAAPIDTCPTFIMMWDDEQFSTAPFDPTDGYQLFEVCPDWPGTTILTGPTVLDVGVEFDAELCGFGACVPQPGTGTTLDVLGQFTMHRTTMRYDADAGTLTAVVTHTVDTGGNLAGVRWTELDMLGGPAVVNQGVFAPDSEHRWMPSAATDKEGNIGIGYSLGSGSTFPSIFLAGRQPGDPAGTLKAEVSCVDGTGSQTGTSRWGDYASMSVDPADGCTFFFATEYVPATSPASWVTQVCKFNFSNCASLDPIFADGFETGDTTMWSVVLP